MALADHFREFRARLLRSLLVLVLALASPSSSATRCSTRSTAPHRRPGEAARGHDRRHAAGLRRAAAVADAVRLRRRHLHRALLALPDLGVRAAGALRAGAEDDAGLRRRRRPPLPRRGGARLPHPAEALEVLIGFNPDGVTNLTDFNDYLQFFTRTLFVFGLAFNIPVFVVLLNFAGVVKGAARRLPPLDHHRHVLLRRGGDAVGRPVHDDADGPARWSCSSSPRRRSRASTTGAAPARPPMRGSGPTALHPLSGLGGL